MLESKDFKKMTSKFVFFTVLIGDLVFLPSMH